MAGVGHDDAARGFQAAMSGQYGVAIGILRVQALDGQPAADVIPLKGCLYHEHFLGMFEHCEVDTESVERFVFATKDSEALAGEPSGGNPLHGREEPRLALA